MVADILIYNEIPMFIVWMFCVMWFCIGAFIGSQLTLAILAKYYGELEDIDDET